MTALTEIGEMSISQSGDDGRDYLLRPSFMAMNRIGSPDEIVSLYATVHGHDVSQIMKACAVSRNAFPEWMAPSLYRSAERVLSASMLVMQSCCEDDLAEVIGEWKGWRNCVVYRPGKMSKNDIIIFAQNLMQHGIIGRAKVRQLQRHENKNTTAEFRAIDYIVAAQTHFGISEEEASRLTMTKFQMLLAAKYPDQKGFTREEYDKVSDEFLAKQAARRAKAESAKKP